MRLTTYTDYALRTLMYLATSRDRLVTVQDIADAHDIAKNHLTKVVHQLGTLGFVESLRGRNGGLLLGREPAQINIGEVVRSTEPDFYMAECFDPQKSHCILDGNCILKSTLHSATQAYLAVLNGVTLADLMKNEGSREDGNASFRSIPIRARAAPPVPHDLETKKVSPGALAGQPKVKTLDPAPAPLPKPQRPGSR